MNTDKGRRRPLLSGLRMLPAGIWMLGFVSMFMDISSELIHSLLPGFMATVLGASMTTIGLVEGVCESAAAVTKVLSGAISDRLGKRKVLAVAGYGLAALTKPLFALATTVGWVFSARFLDRVGKGIRGAPRDALVADLTPSHLRGAAFGLRQSLDCVGSVLGPLLGVVLMLALDGRIRDVFWVAIIPAAASVGLLVLFVRDERTDGTDAAARPRLDASLISRIPGRVWHVVALGTVFTLARFSEAFLVLRAQDLGLGLAWVPLVLVSMNIAYTATAYPAGVASDRLRPRDVLICGLVLLVVADLVLAFAGSVAWVLAGAAIWGLHMGFTQGVFARLVADAAPRELRGTAFGVFHLATGLGLLLASLGAGYAWTAFGARAPFLLGAGFAALTLAGLFTLRTRGPSRT